MEISINSTGGENVLPERLANIKAIHFRPESHVGEGYVFVDRQPTQSIFKLSIDGGIDGTYVNGDNMVIVIPQGEQFWL